MTASLVANYSGFYRLPLGNPDSIAEQIAEPARQLRLQRGHAEIQPAAAIGRAGTESLREPLDDRYGGRTISWAIRDHSMTFPASRTVRQVFQDVATGPDGQQQPRVPAHATPLPPRGRRTLHIHRSPTGLDYKTYNLLSTKTNNFQFTEITVNAMTGNPNPPVVSKVSSPVPAHLSRTCNTCR